MLRSVSSATCACVRTAAFARWASGDDAAFVARESPARISGARSQPPAAQAAGPDEEAALAAPAPARRAAGPAGRRRSRVDGRRVGRLRLELGPQRAPPRGRPRELVRLPGVRPG